MAKKQEEGGRLDKALAKYRGQALDLGSRVEVLAENLGGLKAHYAGNDDLTSDLAAAEKSCRALAASARALRRPLDAAKTAAGRGFEEQTELDGGAGKAAE